MTGYTDMLRWQAIVVLLLLFTSSTISQQKEPVDVLFVGNSYTYFWNLPHVVAAMAETKDISINARQSTAGGTNLGQHLKGQKDLNTVGLIAGGSFEFVILQDHSLRALEAPDSLLYYGGKLGEMAIRDGTKPIVYITWARRDNPLMQHAITTKYLELGRQINALVAPVGPAWELARNLRPDLELFDKDGSHQSPMGTYLSACVFFYVLTGESPVGLPARLISKDIHGEKLYLSINNPLDATFCQQVAEKVVDQFNK